MSEEMAEWVKELPEVLQSAPFIQKAESAEDAVAKIQHAAQYMGRAVKFPTDDSSDEERSEFYTKILEQGKDILRIPDEEDKEGQAAFNERFGVPKESKDYATPDVDDWSWEDSYIESMRGIAKSAGLNARQYKSLMSGIAKYGLQQDELSESEIADGKQALEKEWGAAYADRMDLIKNWSKLSDAPPELTDMIESGNMNADTANWLHGIANKFTNPNDDNKPGGDKNDRPGKVTPLEAQEKIAQILDDKDYFDVASPRHKILKQRMFEMQTALAAEQD